MLPINGVIFQIFWYLWQNNYLCRVSNEPVEQDEDNFNVNCHQFDAIEMPFFFFVEAWFQKHDDCKVCSFKPFKSKLLKDIFWGLYKQNLQDK